MSVSNCALSGQALQNPVVSVKTGHVFERDLIKKHVDQTGQCPITGVDLNFETDFVELKVANASLPKPIVANNIPGILTLFQSEWDSLMLEVFQLRKNLDQTRKELSQALYQHDAACRVICRLLKEKEELQSMLAMTNEKMEEFKSTLASQVDQGRSNFMREEQQNEGIYKELVTRMETLSENLSEKRRKTKAPAAYPKSENLSKLKEANKFPAHETTKPGVLDLDIHPTHENYIISGGRDSKAVLIDAQKGQVVKKFEPFASKKKGGISVTRFLPGQHDLYALLGNEDGNAGVWALNVEQESYQERYSIKTHSAAITGVTFQPLNEYAVLSSKDKSWSFHNMAQGVCLYQHKEDQEVSSIEFHPDGLMLVAGYKNGLIKIYDIRTQTAVTEINKLSSHDVTSLSFSNKGLNFAAGSRSSDVVNVFNLRKLGQDDVEVRLGNGMNVGSVNFDFYGGHLVAGAGKGIGLWELKKWDAPVWKDEQAHEGPVNVVRFSASGNLIASGSDDRFLKIYQI